MSDAIYVPPVSVGLTAPGILSVSGSPVNGTGTLGLTLATQTANTVFAGPSTGSAAAPTFRVLASADVPVPLTLTSPSVGSVPLDLKASSGQTANLLNFSSSTGTGDLGSIDKSANATLGTLTVGKITGTGGLTNYGYHTITALSTPAAPTFTTATTGGTLAPGTYYYRVSAVSGTGETLASTEASKVVPAGTSTNTVTLTLAVVTGAESYNVYGRSTGAELKIGSAITAATFTDTGSVTPSGALPTVNTTGQLTVPYALTVPNISTTTFSGAINFPSINVNVSTVSNNGIFRDVNGYTSLKGITGVRFYTGNTVTGTVNATGDYIALGSITATTVITAISTKTTAYTATTTDETLLLDTTTATFALTLPSAATAGAGHRYTLKWSAGAVAPTVIGTVDGGTLTFTTVQQARTIESNGTGYFIVASYL